MQPPLVDLEAFKRCTRLLQTKAHQQLQSLWQGCAALIESMVAGELKKVVSQAQKLKSIAAHLGARELSTRLADVESLASHDELDQTIALVAPLDRIIERSKALLNRALSDISLEQTRPSPRYRIG